MSVQYLYPFTSHVHVEFGMFIPTHMNSSLQQKIITPTKQSSSGALSIEKGKLLYLVFPYHLLGAGGIHPIIDQD